MKKLSRYALGLAVLGAVFAARRPSAPPGQFVGKTVLVTGGSRGLGFLVAREFGRRGADVIICARDEAELDRARDALRLDGINVVAIPCDVAERRQVALLVEEATAHFGGIDVLVNNAGIIQVGGIETATLEDFDEALDTMFWGTLHPIWEVLPQMIERGEGRIVNITSVGGKVSVPHLLPYSSAKFAALGLSEGLRAELGPRGISVTTIVPGLMRTGSYIHAIFKGQHAREFSWFALGSSLPGITINAERAAVQIVDAAYANKAEKILSVPAKLIAWFNGLFPGTTASVIGQLASRLLPADHDQSKVAMSGQDARAELSGIYETLFDAATTLGRRAGQRYLQYGN